MRGHGAVRMIDVRDEVLRALHVGRVGLDAFARVRERWPIICIRFVTNVLSSLVPLYFLHVHTYLRPCMITTLKDSWRMSLD